MVTTVPLFPLARNAFAAVGVRVHTLELAFDRGYQLDLEALAQTLTPHTRLVSLASPQNPSGVALSRQTLHQVLALIARHSPKAYLLVDETYREAAYGDDPVAASAVGLGERVISCASLSKCHGAPGLRLGWLITRDTALRERLVTAKFNTIISCSVVDEALALAVFQRQDKILGDRRRHLAQGLAQTAAWVARHGEQVAWVRPDAGALCCLRLKPEAFGDQAVARFYAELAQRGIRAAPGTWFGDEARVFRLGFGFLPLPDLAKALNALGVALAAAKPSTAAMQLKE